MTDAPLVVQLSFPPPRAVVNPYTVMLTESLAAMPGVQVRNFSWRSALLDDYDIFHVHWPETLVAGRTPMRALARQGLFLLLLARLSVTGRPWVRTVHNLHLPDGLSRRQRWLLGLADRRTTLRIILNEQTPVPPGEPHALIPHGHYRDWFARYERREAQAGSVAYAGRIRRYKGVEDLLEAFRAVDPQVSGRLVVAGLPSSPALADEVERAARADARIEARLEFLPDDQFVEVVTGASLVVLPYKDMHNSGTALAALSLDRPILVPDTEVNAALAAEVGRSWVLRFSGTLDSQVLRRALGEVRSQAQGAGPDGPDLSARGWAESAAAHVRAYREALALRGRRRVLVRAGAQEA